MSKHPSGCYVYAISVDGVVRYIGKGTGNRMARHFRRAQAAIAIRAVGGTIRTSNLHHCMIHALLAGQTLHGDVLREGMTDAEACALERQEIALRDGLWNLREGGEGWTSAEVKALWADPAFRDRMSETSTQRWLRPEYRDRVMAGLARMDDDARTARDRGLEAGRTPEARAKQAVGRNAKLRTPEARARQREVANARWARHRAALAADADGSYAAAFKAKNKRSPEHIAAMRRGADKPEAKEKHRKSAQARWDNTTFEQAREHGNAVSLGKRKHKH